MNKVHILFFLFSLVILTPIYPQIMLQKESHLFRDGDVILKQELQYKSPGRSGQNVVWDFSELLFLESSYQETFLGTSDSILACVSPRSKYEYKLLGDSLVCIGYQVPGLDVEYFLPELCRHYPMSYNDSLYSLYYGEGRYSHTLNVTVYGETVHRVDASGVLMLPGGDTLHVLRIHESVHMGQQLSASSSILSHGDKERYSPNLLLNKLAHDSLTWVIDTYRWYALGYRYPVFETIQTSFFSLNTLVRHFSRSYYYPLDAQRYLSEDKENRRAREEFALQKDRRYSIDPRSQQNTEDFSYNYYQSQDGNMLNVELLLKKPLVVEILLCSVSGYCLERKHKNAVSGMYNETFDISSLPVGNYILSVIVNEKTLSEKILKK